MNEVIRNNSFCNFCEHAFNQGETTVETTGVFATIFDIQHVHCRAKSPGGAYVIYNAETDKKIEESAANSSILKCPIPTLVQIQKFRKDAHNRVERKAKMANPKEQIDRSVPPLQPGNTWLNLHVVNGVPK